MPRSKKGAAHWPINSASLSTFPLLHFRAADTPIANNAAPKNTTDGIFAV
ncbi:hypothetical protein GQF61_14835 [Sphingobacterium sp. DK4209]|nr:hypothetical protein [Sphingobacterium sp. DK4209]